MDKELLQLNGLYYALLDGLHDLGVDTSIKENRKFVEDFHRVILKLRVNSSYNGKFETLDDETYNKLKNWLHNDLYEATNKMSFTEESLKIYFDIMKDVEKSFKKEKEDEIYPLTIIEDRYSGTYSGGGYLAFNLEETEIPEAVSGSDLECAFFWQKTKIIVGKGMSPEEAKENLIQKLKAKKNKSKK